ncbi:sodium:alanine symporter family protein [Halalkalibacterium halodurans]|nr:sodium:alanine symporter family protein [Halalkalibacterium halodurans]MDY7223244.1 sodium:alanine symporter family protein [Halalkalibacterium halodurans]MDY7242465.1 sodium:alanine symporter family protein [Halalkalibacterium halodurans]MED4080299.1 sodium:alanine symporter family protein [Halalkalibacterium halodurans]MED4084633.1 sodium:alanine symporter family protein [Halalkalibacterium halodurans]MED4103987.1 sodium:alanine symporter family protein [Halalkalibacterium halodurans]
MFLLEKIIEHGNNFLWSYLLIALLVGLGVFFTIRTKFAQITNIKEMFRLMKESPSTSDGKKRVSSFGAFCISAASRIGTGNLAGVAIAITLGGPGAIFWMWVVAIFGSVLSFIESTLAQVYKVKDKNGFKGGPAYYMEKALGQRWLGITFAILITFCFGLTFNSVQANTISAAFEEAFGFNSAVIGVVLAVVVGFVIFGGVKRIAKVSQVVVPVMAGFYLLLAAYVVIFNIGEVPAVFQLIVSSAFGLEQAIGGGIGAAIMNGVKRGLFSNEAGMGSAPVAAATADVSHPAKQGFIQTLGVFVDTLLICSATAFIILLAGTPDEGLSGIQITQAALSSHVGSWATYFVAFAILLFCFSSIIGNYYYGESNLEYIKENKSVIFLFRLAVLGMVIYGSVESLATVWDLADLFMALMALVNLVALALIGKVALAVLKDYLKQKKEGKDPVFYSSNIEGLKHTECWEKEEVKRKNA